MVDTDKLYELKKQLRKLSAFQGSGTELISVYIPAGSPIHDMAGKLREEMSQASNIKSKSTRTNVTGALERIIHHLKVYKQTPPHGIAVFCGNISDNPSKVVIELFSLEPPQPLQIGMYRCDSRFFLDPLRSMTDVADSYGIVVMDGREATLALVRGTIIRIVKRLNSTAHAKIRKGGQSARRYERLIEESIEKYYVRVGLAMDEHFLNNVKGVIVGGPGPTKDFFMKASPFNYQIKVLGVVDTGYTDEYGVREVLAKSEGIIAQQEAVKERALVERFIKEIVNEGGLATYGINEVKEAIINRQADTVLISEELDYNIGFYSCSSCNEEQELVFRGEGQEKVQCKKCNGEAKPIKTELLLEYLISLSRDNNIKVEIISTHTTEGAQFLQGFAGIGAFLRYRTR